VALPWAWFALRELGGRVEAVAVALPLVVIAALVILVGVAAARREVLVLPAAHRSPSRVTDQAGLRQRVRVQPDAWGRGRRDHRGRR
jgi:hypothetical protein